MEVTELMIDDLVRVIEPDPYHEHIGVVKSIGGTNNYITVYLLNLHNQDVFIEDVAPVPITNEILEKFGFTCYDNYATIIRRDDSTGENWKAKYVYFGSKIEIVNGDDNKIKAHCYSVHELQHLLRFCEINKETICGFVKSIKKQYVV